MKVVMISSVPAFPTIAGNRARIATLAHALQEMSETFCFVQLPAQADAGDPAAHQDAYGAEGYYKLHNGHGFGPMLYTWRCKMARAWRKGLRRVGITAGHYSALDGLWNTAWDRQLSDLLKDADAVIVEYVFMTRAFDQAPATARRILDTHDAFGDRHKLYQGLSGAGWISLRRHDEIRGFRRAQDILAIQPTEADHFCAEMANFPPENHEQNPHLAVVSHLLDLSNRTQDLSQNNRAMFLASKNAANVEAVRMLISHVLPLIVAQIPNFELVLVGSIADEVVDQPNVRRLGRVEDLREAFTMAPVMLNPMTVGTGINIKLLDALAAGVPTISTDVGARGLPDAYRGGVITVANDNYTGFAEHVISLVQDKAARAEIGAKAVAGAQEWNRTQRTVLHQCLTGAHAEVCSDGA